MKGEDESMFIQYVENQRRKMEAQLQGMQKVSGLWLRVSIGSQAWGQWAGALQPLGAAWARAHPILVLRIVMAQRGADAVPEETQQSSVNTGRRTQTRPKRSRINRLFILHTVA